MGDVVGQRALDRRRPHRQPASRQEVTSGNGRRQRTTVVGGSFFELVPSGGDAHVLKHIVRDWDESKRLEILRNVPI
ncbi:MAG TPA: methyltransferase [Mycobacterium sp.]